MFHILLATWLSTQQWAWDKIPDTQAVTAYRIYWGASGVAWCSQNKVEISSTSCGVLAGCGDDLLCCGDIPEPPFTPAYIMVTAVNAAGESLTEHGDVVNCP